MRLTRTVDPKGVLGGRSSHTHRLRARLSRRDAIRCSSRALAVACRRSAEISQMDPCYSMFLSLASHCHRPLGNCQARFATSPRFNPPSLPRIMVFHSTMAQIGCLWAHFPCWFRESDAFGQSISPILPQARGAHGLSASGLPRRVLAEPLLRPTGTSRIWSDGLPWLQF